MADSTVRVMAAGLVAGVDYPMDTAQFRAWFPDDDACLDFLDWLRWPGGFVCPHCAAVSAGVDDRRRYRCHGCRRRVSVTAGTIFEGTRIPLTVWFEAAWMLTTDKTGVSAAHIHRVLPINSYPTAWAMLARLRSVMSSAGRDPLAGRVEVDETFFGGPRPGKAGRGALGKTLVAGAIEITDHGWGRARLTVISDASAASLNSFITTAIKPGATVLTDAWPAYPSALSGYIHQPLNISASGRPAHESLPAVHRLFALVKRSVEGTYQGSGSPEHLGEYLDEFVFRFNRRHARHRGLVFTRLLQQAVTSDPVRFQDLVRCPTPGKVSPQVVTRSRSRPGSLDRPQAHRPWRTT